MSGRKGAKVVENAENCVICFKKVDVYSLGQCDHPVCFECSTRMRVLCRQNECPICRQELPKVLFTRNVRPFEQIKLDGLECDEKYKIVFSSQDIKNDFERLLLHECKECEKIFPNFKELRDHMRRAHQLTYCDLCVDNLKILTSERRCYTRYELAQHRRLGDANDRSLKGHPLCKFCETRYMDNDELYRHVRRDHLFCHFCDADGIHQYYQTYELLREHFKREHYLCEEGDCYMEKFTSVFRSEIDLKAHRARDHGRTLGKAGLKQARTLDIEFSLSSRPRVYMRKTNREGHHSNHQEEEVEPEPVMVTTASQKQPNTECREEFPTLGSAPVAPHSHKVTATVRSRPPAYEDFPALPTTSTSGTTEVSLRVDSDQPTPSANFSIKVNHPRFTTTVTASKKSPDQQTYNYNFPALDTAEPTSSVSSKWTSKKEAPKQPQRVVKQNKTPPKLDDFPALAPKPAKPKAEPKPKAEKPKAEPKPKAELKPSTPKETKSTASNTEERKSKKKKSKQKSEVQVAGTSVKKKSPEHLINKENEKVTVTEDFPALGNTKAPPGFDVKWAPPKRPPPGLAPPVAPPPGFSVVNESFPALCGGDNFGEYLAPKNFDKRNTALMDKVDKALIKGSNSLVEFKDVSLMYLTGIIPAENYYEHCRTTLKIDTFSELFPELVALLPDIAKQEPLYKLYSSDSEIDSSKLKKCAVCGQVLRTGDFNEHHSKHSLDNHFPPFVQKHSKNKPNAWAK